MFWSGQGSLATRGLKDVGSYWPRMRRHVGLHSPAMPFNIQTSPPTRCTARPLVLFMNGIIKKRRHRSQTTLAEVKMPNETDSRRPGPTCFERK